MPSYVPRLFSAIICHYRHTDVLRQNLPTIGNLCANSCGLAANPSMSVRSWEINVGGGIVPFWLLLRSDLPDSVAALGRRDRLLPLFFPSKFESAPVANCGTDLHPHHQPATCVNARNPQILCKGLRSGSPYLAYRSENSKPSNLQHVPPVSP